MEPHPKESTIAVDDLLVGEHSAMNDCAMVWAHLYRIKPKYLRSLISRLEKDVFKQTQMSLPLFKLILFYAENLQDHMKNDPELMKALEDQAIRSEMRQMFGGPKDF